MENTGKLWRSVLFGGRGQNFPVYPTWYILLILIPLLLTNCAKDQQDCTLKITRPTCEQLNNPIGIDIPQPRFSWQLQTSCPNQQQTAYHIIVSSTKEKLQQNESDIWNTKKIISSKTLHIPFEGFPLRPTQTYFWKVRVWNAEGTPSDWSDPQQWTMGLIGQNAKQANWIGLNIPLEEASEEQKNAAHYFSTVFKTQKDKTIRQAVAFVSGLGLFDFYLNGQRVSDHRLNPANTNYFKRAIYIGFDVSQHMNRDANTVGIVLGNGKHFLERNILRLYGLPRLWCQIHIQYDDGSTQIINSDGNWEMTTQGPIRFNSEFHGEHYDARMDIAHWATASMNTTNWQQVDILQEYKPILTPQLMPPVRVVDTLLAKKITPSDNGKYIFDFGQNLTGWGNLKIKGERGTEIRLRFTELLDSLGNLDATSIRGARATDIYVLKGEGLEGFEPRFTYHGFRYVEISGLTTPPTKETLKACVAHNDLETVGTFVCSDPLLNQIYRNAQWSIRGNYQHVPVDCPQRDERYGWLGDRAATAFGELYLYDIQHMYTKWMQDIADEQLESGALPNLAPAHWEQYRDNVTWPAAYIQLVGLLYRYYGDDLVVAQHYANMKKWMDYIYENYSAENIVYSDQYGDWSVPPPKANQEKNKDFRLKSSADILATVSYILALKDMYAFAMLLQKKEDVQFYKKQKDALTSVLYNRLMDKSQHSYGNHSPTELLLLLAGSNLSLDDRAILMDNLFGMLQGQYDGKMAFGLVGMRNLMQALSKNGAEDFAYQLATSRTYPSWGYMVEQGATTMWEVWTGQAKKSQNHVMLIGDLLQWFYAYLGGIQQADDGIAFDKLKLLPYLPNGLDSVDVTFLSPRGKIVSHWKKKRNKLHWHVEIPVGTTAELYLPYDMDNTLEHDGQFLRLDTLQKQTVYNVLKLGSGQHHFTCKLPEKAKQKKYASPPEISLQDSIIARKQGEKYWVSLAARAPQTEIYYTLDGSDPDLKSKQYKEPFELHAHTMIKAIAKEKGKAPSYAKSSFVDIYDPEVNGWHYWYYQAPLKYLPDFDTLQVLDKGRTSIIDSKKLEKRSYFWGFRFDSNLEIPRTGMYTFYLESDDGAKLIVNNQEVIVNDGIHYKTQRKGQVHLAKGRHRIRMEHFNWWSYNGLELLISGPQLPRQRVPVSWLYY